MDKKKWVSSGLEGLDHILDGLRIGDNVVWKVDDIEDYILFVDPFIKNARIKNKKIVYFRFAKHRFLLDNLDGIRVETLDPALGFEAFAVRIHTAIEQAGPGTFYVFDCLSDLITSWATDYMVGNFFLITCPFLFQLDTVAYFALIRNSHSWASISKIRDTTQLLLQVYNLDGRIYVHPLKVWQRNSPTMFLPHLKDGQSFTPLANSIEATNLLSSILKDNPNQTKRHLDHWHHLFLQAEQHLYSSSEPEKRSMAKHLCKHIIGGEEKILELATKYFSLSDLLEIKSCMIGSGFIGGKATGMLLARSILLQDDSFAWQDYLEEHDSFYIGSNIYYNYLVYNGLWPLFVKQKTDDGYYSMAKILRANILKGKFSPETKMEFQQVLEYFGQYPFIVRSSSILEDSFGNAFAGKYESHFCVNQGSPEQRLLQFEEAVKKIIASTMSEDALAYRRQRGLDKRQEQMGLLIQRVSGAYHKHYYFPDLAGVGISFNTYVWNECMDKNAGMLRLVWGLGTRAVDRVESDYPRIVALDWPSLLPHHGLKDAKRYSQKEIDLLDVNSNSFRSLSVSQVLTKNHDMDMQLYAQRDHETMQRLEDQGLKTNDIWILSFEKLLTETPFAQIMQRMLKTIEKAYGYPVDIEFTVNYTADKKMKINIVQCRPLQTRGDSKRKVFFPENIAERHIFFDSSGNFMGGSISQHIDMIIYIDPFHYSQLPLSDKYDLARQIGHINRRIGERNSSSKVMLIGPGRWGSSTPQLGIPVSFAEINNISVLVEMSFRSGGLMPDISYGSHFFHDLVETNIFYIALYTESDSCMLRPQTLDSHPNTLSSFIDDADKYQGLLHVVVFDRKPMRLVADIVSQRVLCFEP